MRFEGGISKLRRWNIETVDNTTLVEKSTLSIVKFLLLLSLIKIGLGDHGWCIFLSDAFINQFYLDGTKFVFWIFLEIFQFKYCLYSAV